MHVVRLMAKVGLWYALAALVAAGTLWASAPIKQSTSGRMRSSVVKDHRQIPWFNDKSSSSLKSPFPVVADRMLPASGLRASGSSPGILIYQNAFDLQHDDGTVRQIASRGGGAWVHFAWTELDFIPNETDGFFRAVLYNAYNTTDGLAYGNFGIYLRTNLEWGLEGFVGVDVGSDDNAHAFLHRLDTDNQPWGGPHVYSSWVWDQGTPSLSDFDADSLPGSVEAEAIWPHGAIDRGGSSVKTPGDDVYHVCSHVTGDEGSYTDELFYWRRVGEYPATWEGPVVLDHVPGGSLSHHVATDPTDENVAVIYASDRGSPWSLMQVLYLESANNGADWITAGVPAFPTAIGPSVNGGRQYVTDYTDPDGPAAWFECTGEYDSQGRLHIVWVEQATADVGEDCRILHWDDVSFTTRLMTEATGWASAGAIPSRSLWLTSPQIGFGDGNTSCTDGPANPGGAGATSNLDYLYVTYEQYGGPTSAEENDAASNGYQNAEIYLTVSNDLGASWSAPINLTNTQTPGCDGTVPGNECASEKDPSIGFVVDDTLHLFYCLDTDAGEAVYDRGSWTWGAAMYYRIPGGTDTQPICPALNPALGYLLSNSDPDCEYHATLNPPGLVAEQLSILNLGNAPLTGSVAITPPSATWLTVSPAAFSVAPGGAPDVRPLVMDAGDASISGEGLYSAQIEISHNDPSLANPFAVPVDFFVFDEFYCPEYVTLHTDCLWLVVSNTERIGNQNRGLSGLSRLGSDSSWSVYDGSLIIGVPPNPDTLVYRTVYGGGNGYPGFRALSNLVVDTSAYGTFTGYASASAAQTTTDSTIGVDVQYVFPQAPDSCEFVLIKYRVYNKTQSDLLNLAVGEAVDFDVIPGVDQRALQIEQQNTGHIRTDFNMLYQQGADTTGHVIVGDNTATRFKAGITSIQCDAAPRGWIAPNTPWLTNSPGGGFSEGYLYQEMTKSGFEIFPPYNPDPEEDVHSVLVFDNNLDLAPGASAYFVAGLVSSNTGTNETDLINTTKKAWRYSFGWKEIVTSDTVPESTPASYPYRAFGSHEDGLAGGCCGCLVTKVSGAPELTVGGGAPGDCAGTIEFAGGIKCHGSYAATFSVEDLCGTYADFFVMTIDIDGVCSCECPHQGDCDWPIDPFVTALDLGILIDHLFAGGDCIKDPDCPTIRCDFDCDCYSTALDLGKMIDYLFAGGDPPCNPCTAGPGGGPITCGKAPGQ